MTFRDHCILKAALALFAQQTTLPRDIELLATNGTQFTVQPSDALIVGNQLDAAVFADRIVGNLTKTDAAAIGALIEASMPSQRKDRAAKGRQQRFAQRVQTFIGN